MKIQNVKILNTAVTRTATKDIPRNAEISASMKNVGIKKN